MRTYPMLYKKASTGKDLQWRIWVDGSTIHEEWGQIGGKLQQTSDTVREGKNIGRSNETTPEEQAEAEAQSKWEKKIKAHNYTESLGDAQAGKSGSLVEGGQLPMLAKKFAEDGDKLEYPAACQPKLDGHRCLAVVDGKGKCTLWSRTRKPILSMPHIIKAVEALGVKNMVWDGELYLHEYHDRFEEITSLIRPAYAKPGHEKVEYHIYDIAQAATGIPLDFKDRNTAIQVANLQHPLVAVETRIVANEDELMVAFEDFLAQGYEGAIARNLKGAYVNKRSHNLLKLKKFDDGEFKITGVKEGRGKLTGHGIFECVTAKGAEFEAKMKGDTTKLKEYFQHPERYIGKMLTVQYFGLTKYGVPRFPVALRLREDV